MRGRRGWRTDAAYRDLLKGVLFVLPGFGIDQGLRFLSRSWVPEMGHSVASWDQRAAFEVVKDWNGIDQVVLRVPRGASARDPRLACMEDRSSRGEMTGVKSFCSPAAILKPPKAIRGGIPLCFPQFGNCGSLELHGFARNRIWTIEDDPPPFQPKDCNGKVCVDLLLRPSEEDLKCWPHCFEFRLRVSLGMDGDLSMISRIRNIDGKPFSFSFAYHTYFSVSDIRCLDIDCEWDVRLHLYWNFEKKKSH
ncbi:hypothetical protein Taro_007530 [Colocasia esculenta]|uniref:Glucose-6-phosphate 1-epimerase n=1 Tax=Colocasia esculenta TaxID=4460 RepID=A0A843U0K0_COLES|nr:hypothetical protein [Colocasia esculenta]